MRTSRISKETSKVVTATSPTTRRITRSSLSRYARDGNGRTKGADDAAEDDAEENDGNDDIDRTAADAAASDIEDALSPVKKHRRTSSRTSTPRRTATTPRKTVTIKTEIEDSLTFSPSPKKERRARKPAHKVKSEDGSVAIHPPTDWQQVYDVVMQMRKTGAAQNAAVDTMGCESLAQADVSARDKRFHTLIALMLSSQTKDTTNAMAMNRLYTELPVHQAGAPPGLNLENILAVEPEVLNELIWVVGFHNNKTRYIKATAEILRDKWNSDIPDTAEGLMSLPGVGPKMAYLCLSSAWGKTEGIGVDVHVHRITNLWGWHKTNGPEESRLILQEWLPREKWHEINWLLVGFGQKICLPVGRKCGECELGLQGLCRAAERGKVIAGRKIKEEKTKREDGDVVEVEKTEEIEEEIVTEGVVNAPADAEVDVKGQEGIPLEEGLTKEEEKEVIEEMVNAPGKLEKLPVGRNKRRR